MIKKPFSHALTPEYPEMSLKYLNLATRPLTPAPSSPGPSAFLSLFESLAFFSRKLMLCGICRRHTAVFMNQFKIDHRAKTLPTKHSYIFQYISFHIILYIFVFIYFTYIYSTSQKFGHTFSFFEKFFLCFYYFLHGR